MTPRQFDALRAIARLTRQQGFAPTFAELAAELGTSSNSQVPNAIDALEDEGLVVRGRGWRSLVITAAGHELLERIAFGPRLVVAP